jgi:transcriptional regulator with XRE-family HTH domain
VSEYYERVREFRERQGLLQEDLARASGLTASYVSRIERGKVPTPSYQTLIALARALEVSLPSLVEEEAILDSVEQSAELITKVASVVGTSLDNNDAHRIVKLMATMNEAQLATLLDFAKYLQSSENNRKKQALRQTKQRDRNVG